MNRTTFYLGIGLLAVSCIYWAISCASRPRNMPEATSAQVAVKSPPLGSRGRGPSYDKSGDSTLRALKDSVLPEFALHEFHDVVTDSVMAYHLLRPATESGRTYPLVLFMADASTPGLDPAYTLTQGYGALVWGAPSWQREHPCFVLVPQFSGVAVNDAFQHTPEVETVIRLLDFVANSYPVDRSRIYTTGQSMGGMISLYYNAAYPDVFAASMLVDCHWDPSLFPQIVKHPLAYIVAGGNSKSTGGAKAMIEAAREAHVKYAYREFSARLPLARQDSIAARMLREGASLNVICFEPGTVLPPGDRGNEHMHSFDKAYQLTPVREWLFRQRK